MSSHLLPKIAGPTVTVRVSGKLLQNHLRYLDQLVQSAGDCLLWPLLSLSCLEELDHPALLFLMNGENHNFSIVSCPDFIRLWMEHEKHCKAA
jgi:hypothetical protein